MKYKLKKELTKEDLIYTKWIVNNPDKSKALHLIANSLGMSSGIDCTKEKLNKICETKDHLKYYSKFILFKNIHLCYPMFEDWFDKAIEKEMNFDDWFEEDKSNSVQTIEPMILENVDLTGFSLNSDNSVTPDCKINELEMPTEKEMERTSKIVAEAEMDKVKNREGTFMWAVEQMKQGKNLICNALSKELYLAKDGFVIGFFYRENGNLTKHQGIDIEFIEATDWEIFEEKSLVLIIEKQRDKHIKESLIIPNKIRICSGDIKKLQDENIEINKIFGMKVVEDDTLLENEMVLSFEDPNTFGDFEVSENGLIWLHTFYKDDNDKIHKFQTNLTCTSRKKDLEKAIKRAREIKNE